MIPKEKAKLTKKIALVLSVCTLLVWSILGTGASLAWFMDVSPDVDNIFHFAEFDIVVSHRLTDGNWEEVTSNTKIFNDNALYEPGYVQVAYLKIKNNGNVDFMFDSAVSVTGYTVATNVYEDEFNLHDYLRFGYVTADTEQQLREKIDTREKASEYANLPLNNYTSTPVLLPAGEETFVALIVRMPKEVGNEANYKGDTIPTVELGIIIKADQIRK